MDEKDRCAIEQIFARAKEGLEAGDGVPTLLYFYRSAVGFVDERNGGVVDMYGAGPLAGALRAIVPRLRSAGYDCFVFLNEAWHVLTVDYTAEELVAFEKEWTGRMEEHPDRLTSILLYVVVPGEQVLWVAVYDETAAGYVLVSEEKDEQPDEISGAVVAALRGACHDQSVADVVSDLGSAFG